MLARPVSTNPPAEYADAPYTHTEGGNIGAYDYYIVSVLKASPSLQTQTLPSSHLSVLFFNDSNLCCDVLLEI